VKRFAVPRELIVPKGSTKVADKKSDAVAYLYPSARNGKPAAMVFFGKQSKPVWQFWFPTDVKREAKIAETFANRRDWQARKAAYQAERVAWVPTYKVGDVFRTCWGYDQTNVEYFEIVEIKGKHAILRELCQERVDTGFMQGKCVPLPGQYRDGEEPIRRLMQKGGIRISDCRTAWLCEGKIIGGVRVYDSASWSSYA
jgi:hypothetical protein